MLGDVNARAIVGSTGLMVTVAVRNKGECRAAVGWKVVFDELELLEIGLSFVEVRGANFGVAMLSMVEISLSCAGRYVLPPHRDLVEAGDASETIECRALKAAEEASLVAALRNMAVVSVVFVVCRG